MKHIQEVTLKKAIAMLDAVGCSYHIEIDGVEFGAPIAQKPKRGDKYGYGEITKHIKNHLGEIEIGTCKEIPFGKFDCEDLQSVTSSYLVKTYGKGNCTASRNFETQSIEVLRFA